MSCAAPPSRPELVYTLSVPAKYKHHGEQAFTPSCLLRPCRRRHGQRPGACLRVERNQTVTNNVIAYSGSAIANGLAVGNNVTGVLISQNSIFDNGELGIDLNSDGVSANDALDPDSAANLTQNYPVINTASETAGNVTLTGTFNSVPLSTFTLEFFVSPVCDPSGFGEGKQEPPPRVTVTITKPRPASRRFDADACHARHRAGWAGTPAGRTRPSRYDSSS